jgi:hypothetical protein
VPSPPQSPLPPPLLVSLFLSPDSISLSTHLLPRELRWSWIRVPALHPCPLRRAGEGARGGGPASSSCGPDSTSPTCRSSSPARRGFLSGGRCRAGARRRARPARSCGGGRPLLHLPLLPCGASAAPGPPTELPSPASASPASPSPAVGTPAPRWGIQRGSGESGAGSSRSLLRLSPKDARTSRRRSSSWPWRPGPRHPIQRPSLSSLLRLLHVRIRCARGAAAPRARRFARRPPPHVSGSRGPGSAPAAAQGLGGGLGAAEGAALPLEARRGAPALDQTPQAAAPWLPW